MTTGKQNQGGPCRLRMENLTIYAAGEAVERLRSALAAGPDSLAIDLEGVAEMDTTGLQVLLAAKREAERRDIPLTLSAPSPAVADCLDLVNLSKLFRFDGAAEAVA